MKRIIFSLFIVLFIATNVLAIDILDNPADWLDTGSHNSMSEDDSLFKMFDQDGNEVYGTESTLLNIHSHYIATGSNEFNNYEYTGRMMVTDDGGVGVTFLSDYPNVDAYYRLRNSGGSSFHIAPHPHGERICSGDIDTGVNPQPNIWYQFRIQAEDAGARTEIRASVWRDGNDEPANWQVNCTDDAAQRLSSGTIGVWSGQTGSKYWDDLSVVPIIEEPPPPPPPIEDPDSYCLTWTDPNPVGVVEKFEVYYRIPPASFNYSSPRWEGVGIPSPTEARGVYTPVIGPFPSHLTNSNCFVVKAVDSEGRLSSNSDEVCVNYNNPPDSEGGCIGIPSKPDNLRTVTRTLRSYTYAEKNLEIL